VKEYNYDVLSIVNALPDMKVYNNRNDITGITELLLENETGKYDKGVVLQLENVLLYAIIQRKQIFIQLNDDEKDWYENNVKTHKLSQSILKSFESLSKLSLGCFISFAFSVDNAYDTFIKEVLVVTYHNNIDIPDDAIKLEWSGKELTGITKDIKNVDKKALEELKILIKLLELLDREIIFENIDILKKDLSITKDSSIDDEQKERIKKITLCDVPFSEKKEIAKICAWKITDSKEWEEYISNLDKKLVDRSEFKPDAEERFNKKLATVESLENYVDLFNYNFILDDKWIEEQILGKYKLPEKLKDIKRDLKIVEDISELKFLKDEIEKKKKEIETIIQTNKDNRKNAFLNPIKATAREIKKGIQYVYTSPICMFIIGAIFLFGIHYFHIIDLPQRADKVPTEPIQEEPKEIEQPVVESETPKPINDTVTLFGKINNEILVEIAMQYTEQGLILKPLIDTVKSNSITVDSIKTQTGELIVFPKMGNDSKKMYTILDSLNAVFKSEMPLLLIVDSLILYSKDSFYHCPSDKRITEILRNIPSGNQIDSILIKENLLIIDNEEFQRFNGIKRTLNNFTYCLWLLNEIQQADSTQTIKY
jgi:hypothetical protein